MNLRAEKVTKQYLRSRQGSNVLCAVAKTDLSLLPGTLTVLTGPSGSGKSTLLHMFAGLLPPTSGQILLDDTDLYQLEDKELSRIRNLHMGVIPQGQTALQALSVIENVMVPYTLYRKRKGELFTQIRSRAENLLHQAGLADLKQEMPSALSGGELRRMAVCRALLLQPQIILADEPTGDLDEENTAIVMGLLKEHTKENGTVFVVTHDRQVWEYADGIYEMKNGSITEKTIP